MGMSVKVPVGTGATAGAAGARAGMGATGATEGWQHTKKNITIIIIIIQHSVLACGRVFFLPSGRWYHFCSTCHAKQKSII